MVLSGNEEVRDLLGFRTFLLDKFLETRFLGKDVGGGGGGGIEIVPLVLVEMFLPSTAG